LLPINYLPISLQFLFLFFFFFIFLFLFLFLFYFSLSYSSLWDTSFLTFPTMTSLKYL